MTGVHDLGGMHGFGPVIREENEPVFHAEWEKHVVAIQRATRTGGVINIDEFRHAIERMDPADYLASSYYERWLKSMERRLLEKGVVTREELDRRTAELQGQPDRVYAQPTNVRFNPAPRPVPGIPTEPPAQIEPQFSKGDRVVTLNDNPRGHTRLPRYARGRRGVIHGFQGVYVFPDSHALGQGEQSHPLYSVCFAASELWGADADPNGTVYIDLWERYLQRYPAW
ncbi:MAG: nitrile hydratase subunit beta [Chloroflexota bacterium]